MSDTSMGKVYIVVWTTQTIAETTGYKDHWETRETLDEAMARYDEVRAYPSCFTAMVCAPLASTDYVVHDAQLTTRELERLKA